MQRCFATRERPARSRLRERASSPCHRKAGQAQRDARCQTDYCIRRRHAFCAPAADRRRFDPRSPNSSTLATPRAIARRSRMSRSTRRPFPRSRSDTVPCRTLAADASCCCVSPLARRNSRIRNVIGVTARQYTTSRVLCLSDKSYIVPANPYTGETMRQTRNAAARRSDLEEARDEARRVARESRQ